MADISDVLSYVKIVLEESIWLSNRFSDFGIFLGFLVSCYRVNMALFYSIC